MTKLVIDVETGEVIQRDLNKAEKDQEKIDDAASVAAITTAKAEAEAKATAKAALLERLGITQDEANLLLS